MIPIREHLSVPNETKELKRIRDFVQQVVRKSRMDEPVQNRVILAVDEAVTNIIKHAYEEGRKDLIDLTIDVTPQRFEVVVHDSGKSFRPQEVDPPDIGDLIRRGKRNGMGIFLMRQIMDEVEYQFQEGVRNELRMVKYLS